MKTGCVPPYCHGTGGFCGCNCRCCPPPCCPVIAVYFDCGALRTQDNPAGCDPPTSFAETAWSNLELEFPAPELPDFSDKPIFSADGSFTLGCGSVPCSIPCRTVCVELKCGGFGLPCCCLELLGGKIFSVGNGYVTAPTTIDMGGGCGIGTVLINGSPPPVFVNDCEEITVELITEIFTIDSGSCPCICKCTQVDIQCTPCFTPMAMSKAKPFWKRKVDPRTGKTKINPNTGQPIIVISKKELMKRVLMRIKKSKRRSKD